MTDIDQIIRACRSCGISAGAGSRLPRGWKSCGETALCATCLHAQYAIRAITLPIAGPLDHSWAELGTALRTTWSQTTACANWIVTELYACDIRREAGATKLLPMPKVYLYPEARAKFPGIVPIHLTALLQQVEQTYRRQRYDLLWTGARSLAVHRYPVPAPLHAQGWELEPPDPGNGAMVIRVRLGEEWWRLRLRVGREFAIHVQRLKALVAGIALPAAGAIYAQPSHSGDHRSAVNGRRVLIKLVGWFPVVAPAAATGTLRVSTEASNLLRLARDRHPAQIITGDLLRRQIAAYEVRRGRGQQLDSWRQAQRIKSLCQQIAAEVATHATAAGVRDVAYEDEERGFAPVFPWTKFRLWLQSAVEGRGLQWRYASGETARESLSEERSA